MRLYGWKFFVCTGIACAIAMLVVSAVNANALGAILIGAPLGLAAGYIAVR